jgi:hypothetical protein
MNRFPVWQQRTTAKACSDSGLILYRWNSSGACEHRTIDLQIMVPIQIGKIFVVMLDLLESLRTEMSAK